MAAKGTDIDLSLKKILAAVDGSPQSEKALRYAAVLARMFGANLTIVYAIRGVEISKAVALQSGYERVRLVEALYSASKKEASKWMEEFEQKAKSLGANATSSRILFEPGKSEVKMIIDFAARDKNDLIVMGTRGLSKLKRLLLGSVANGVVNHAPCTVLVVR